MVKSIKRLTGIAKYLYDYELHIRASLKAIYEGHTFSYHRSLQRQTAANAGAVRRDPALAAAFHADWSSIDDHRASVACVLEQFRARVWVLGEVFQSLPRNYDELYHVTYANTRDRRSGGTLSSFNLHTYKRPLRAALAGINAVYPNMWALGIVEISAVQPDPGQFIFEPHFHVLVGGVPENALRPAFSRLLRAATKGSHGLMIDPVHDRQNLGRGLSYLFKFEPELRTKFLTNQGRVGKGRLNHLTGDAKDEWLSWAAAYRIDELLITVGLWPNLIAEFKACELQRLIGKLPHGGEGGSG